ncbi:MAG TPA: hypothetical protein VMD47_06085 [Candidatus Acidoferrales bacterium]|nr:hypothetical protein [Candidatus Acidoferrales bacterium]
MIAAVFAVALGSATIASDSRCNDTEINAIEANLRNYSQHPVAANRQTQREIAIEAAQTDAQQERVILAAVCPDDQYPALAAHLFALDAWADLLAERNGSNGGSGPCPAAEKPVMAGAAASAWVKLAQAASISKPPTLLATLVPQVQAMAAQAGLTLPAFPEASTYWESQYEQAAKQAIVDCASHASTPQPRK